MTVPFDEREGVPLNDDTYTLWGVLGAGEAGCRVASHYFATHPTKSVSDRVLLVNTARADLTNLLKTLEGDLLENGEADRLEIAREQSCIFGDTAGAGNWFFNGEDTLLVEENWQEVSRHISRVFGGKADVIVHMCGLGGGTGNGCLPPMIHRLNEGHLDDVPSDVYQFSVGFWPFSEEGNHRHFNALMGLSRLLRYGDDGAINSDFTLLLGNDELDELADARKEAGYQYQAINRIVVKVLNGLISPGQESVQVIDARDYAVNAQRYQMQHFTAGVGWDIPLMMEFEEGFNKALENLLLPVDPTTSISAHLVLQVPPEEMDDPELSPREIGSKFKAWAREKGFALDTRMESVVPEPTLSNTYNVVLILGGFDLSDLIAPYESLAEQQIKVLSEQFGSSEGRSEEVRTLWERLKEYVEASNERRSVLGT